MEFQLNWFWLFSLSLLHCAVMKSHSLNVIEIEDLSKLASYGIIRGGPAPTILERPGPWKAALRPLDADVTTNVFRVTNDASPTILTFQNNGNLCELTELHVTAKYFSHNSALKAFPCESESGSSHCYGPVPSKVEWVNKKWSMDISQLKAGKEVELLVQLIPGAGDTYFLFEKITIEHDGVDCDTTTTTTEEPSTSDLPTSTEEPTTTDTWVTETWVDESTEPYTDTTDIPTTTVSMEPTTIPTTTEESEEDPETEEPIEVTTTTDETSTTEDPTTESSSTTEDSTTTDERSSTTEEMSTTETLSTTEESSTTESLSTTEESITTESPSTTEDSITTESSSTTEDSTTNESSSTTEDSATSQSSSITEDSSTTEDPTTTGIPIITEPGSSSSLPTSPLTDPTTPTKPTTSTTIETTTDSQGGAGYGSGRNKYSPEEIALYFALPSLIGLIAIVVGIFCCFCNSWLCFSAAAVAAKDKLLLDGAAKSANAAKFGDASKAPQNTNQSPPFTTPSSSGPVSRTSSNVSYLTGQPPSTASIWSAYRNRVPNAPSTTSAIPRTQPSPGFQGSGMLAGPPPLPPRNHGAVTLDIPEEPSRPGSSRGSSRRGSVYFTGEYSGTDLPRLRRKLD